jgi:hypothetical protein
MTRYLTNATDINLGYIFGGTAPLGALSVTVPDASGVILRKAYGVVPSAPCDLALREINDRGTGHHSTAVDKQRQPT